YEQGVLRGWSIGFVPRKASLLPESEAATEGRRGVRVEEWDLLEYSAVPIPENPGALTVAIQKGIVHDGLLRDWLSRVPDDPGGRGGGGGGEKAGGVPPRRNEERVRLAHEHLQHAGALLKDILDELDDDALNGGGMGKGLFASLLAEPQ